MEPISLNNDCSISDVAVHIDAYAAETGVSRFLEQNKNWRWACFLWLALANPSPSDVRLVANRYDKREDVSPESPEMKAYSHLLMEANVTKIKLLRDSHRPLAFTEGYSNIAFDPLRFPPLSVRLERKTVLMERKAGAR